ncbi:PilW family protein [Oceanisphaera psychrotolerans]|uniref:Prepilin-type N-terminal cleavage/methylation domain-containing protein n=1 Tax=Oceanisphaera psychrotolerans TaxID=1414654 RepID=A0A1J4QAY2_9GAMM|nr:type II secretion system protein [Oceanisphaera psychrotolerans]OIN05584.1 hypothetical protein BFR47_05195 [Oceanisphaera psychrotolerans]
MKPLVVAFRLRQQGLTLPELLGAVAILSLLMAGLGGLIGSALELQSAGQTKNTLAQEARFALARMTESVQNSHRLLLPLADNLATSWSEHIRVETVPASPPEGSSTLATAVLAVTLSPRQDLDGDGWADANNDKDFLDRNNNGQRDPGEAERIDEDLDADNTLDGAPGIIGIDDDGDGSVDESSATNPARDNDEQGGHGDDPQGNGDQDGDGAIDEDMPADMNQDQKPGLAGIDDDFDGLIDEGSINHDDDEDGLAGEDNFEPVVYYLSGDQLIERWPAFSDQNGDSLVDGRDYTESVIAKGVTLLRIERVPLGGGRAQLVDITLTLTQDADNSISLQRRVRLGGGL